MKINPLQLEMQPVALEAQNLAALQTSQQVTQNFGQLLSNAINQVNELQQGASEITTAFDMGDRSLTLSDVMIARNKSSIAFEATLQTRNKLIEAYKELMNMPV